MFYDTGSTESTMEEADGIKARCKDLVPDDKLEHILLTLELVPGWETSFYLFKTLSEHFLLDIFSLYHKYYKIS